MGKKTVKQWENQWEFLQWEYLRENKEYQRDYEAVQRNENYEVEALNKWLLDFLVDPRVSASELCQRAEGKPNFIPFPFRAQPVIVAMKLHQADP